MLDWCRICRREVWLWWGLLWEWQMASSGGQTASRINPEPLFFAYGDGQTNRWCQARISVGQCCLQMILRSVMTAWMWWRTTWRGRGMHCRGKEWKSVTARQNACFCMTCWEVEQWHYRESRWKTSISSGSLGSTVQSNGECGKEVKKPVQARWRGLKKECQEWSTEKEWQQKWKQRFYMSRPAMLLVLETLHWPKVR